MKGITIVDSKSGAELFTPKEFFPDYIWKKIENKEALTEKEAKIATEVMLGRYVPENMLGLSDDIFGIFN